MRILHILNDIRNLGNGIINVAVDLACLQARSGHAVGIASAGGEYEALLLEYGVRHFRLEQKRSLSSLIQASWRYREIINEFQPDIVHAHMMTGVVLAWVLRRPHTYALIATVHNEFQHHAVLMGLAERVIAVSQAVANSMVRRGISQEKLRVVRNGTLDSPRRRSLIDSPMTLQHPAIVTVAGMYRRKGIVELIDAFSQIAPMFPNAHLYVIGEGPDRPLFEKQAQNTTVLDRIHFEGFQPQPQRYLFAADIFVLASHREPFGLVLSEARDAGCAIVATAVDGIPEALNAGQAGLLVPPKDCKKLAEALTQLLENPATLHYWKEQAQQNLLWLSVTRVHKETLEVYHEITQSRSMNLPINSSINPPINPPLN
jgi:glycosyltransferase involved in cell wall biosynthesis